MTSQVAARQDGLQPGEGTQIEGKPLLFHGLFWLLSLLFFSPALLTDQALVPNSPRFSPPWSEKMTETPEAGSFNPGMGDCIVLTVPWRTYNGAMLRAGKLPFWNPYIFCGYPHLAALQSNSLYPPVMLFDLWDPIQGIGWSMALHLALAGSLMFAFVRRLGVGLRAAALGAVVFEFSGFFLTRMSMPSYVFTGVWAPLLLLGVHEVVDRRWRRGPVKIAIAVAMAFLGGHPQILVLELLIAGAYMLFALARRSHTSPPARPNESGVGGNTLRALAAAAAAISLGLALTGFQLLPFLELAKESARGPAEYVAVRKIVVPPVGLLQALVPDLFGNPVNKDYWFRDLTATVDPAPEVKQLWGFCYSGENLYTGVAALVFAWLAVFRLRSSQALFFAGLATTALLVLLGTPVLRLFFWLVPTFQHSRPDRITFVYMVALSVLVAFGYHWAESRPAISRVRAGAWLPWLFLVVLTAAVLWPILISPGWEGAHAELFTVFCDHLRDDSGAAAAQAVAGLAVLVAASVLSWLLARRRLPAILAWLLALVLALVPVFRFGWRFNPVQATPLLPATQAEQRLRQDLGDGRIARLGYSRALLANNAQITGIYDANGVSAAALARYVRLVEHIDPQAFKKQKYMRSFQSEAILEAGLLDLLAVSHVLTKSELPLPEAEGIGFGGVRVYKNPDRLPRFFLVDRAETYSTPTAGLHRLLSGQLDLGQVALVPAATLAHSLVQRALKEADELDLLSYDAHLIRITTRTGGRRLLVSSEVEYPGWQAFIDGSPVPTVLVNTAFRGVEIPAGRHEVVFRYVPRSFYAGLVLSVLGLAALCGWVLLGINGKGKQARNRGNP